jgi:hypothetical protein
MLLSLKCNTELNSNSNISSILGVSIFLVHCRNELGCECLAVAFFLCGLVYEPGLRTNSGGSIRGLVHMPFSIRTIYILKSINCSFFIF